MPTHRQNFNRMASLHGDGCDFHQITLQTSVREVFVKAKDQFQWRAPAGLGPEIKFINISSRSFVSEKVISTPTW
jgi:hypothetical protein